MVKSYFFDNQSIEDISRIERLEQRLENTDKQISSHYKNPFKFEKPPTSYLIQQIRSLRHKNSTQYNLRVDSLQSKLDTYLRTWKAKTQGSVTGKPSGTKPDKQYINLYELQNPEFSESYDEFFSRITAKVRTLKHTRKPGEKIIAYKKGNYVDVKLKKS